MTYLSILAFVPLLLIVAAPSLVVPSQAQNTSTVPHYLGQDEQAQVCGDHLCNPSKTVTQVSGENVISDRAILHDHLPEIEVIGAHNFKGTDPHAYIVTLKVTSGAQNIEDIGVLTVSDVESSTSNIGGLFAEKNTKLVVRIHAMDPSTIHASVTGYQLSEQQ